MFSKNHISTNNAIISLHTYVTNFRKKKKGREKNLFCLPERGGNHELPVITSVNSYGTMKGNTRITSIYRNKGGPLLNGSLMDPRSVPSCSWNCCRGDENRIEIKASPPLPPHTVHNCYGAIVPWPCRHYNRLIECSNLGKAWKKASVAGLEVSRWNGVGTSPAFAYSGSRKYSTGRCK